MVPHIVLYPKTYTISPAIKKISKLYVTLLRGVYKITTQPFHYTFLSIKSPITENLSAINASISLIQLASAAIGQHFRRATRRERFVMVTKKPVFANAALSRRAINLYVCVRVHAFCSGECVTGFCEVFCAKGVGIGLLYKWSRGIGAGVCGSKLRGLEAIV